MIFDAQEALDTVESNEPPRCRVCVFAGYDDCDCATPERYAWYRDQFNKLYEGEEG